MTHTSCTTQAALHSGEQLRVLSVFIQLYHQFQARMIERRKRRRLMTLLNCDDAILTDIGHSRAELLMALQLPYSQDARAELKRWRQWRGKTG